jgi:hypothetical protein
MRNNLEPRVLVSIAGAETEFGINITWGAYNAWNWGYNLKDRKNSPFPSYFRGMYAVTSGLVRNYDLSNTATMYARYCSGPDCVNGLRNINQFMREQGADPNYLEFPCRGKGQ